jgi:hypothetical protein
MAGRAALRAASYDRSVTRSVGDFERESASKTLQRHYRDGRLSVEELADRLQLALAARDRAQLRRALRDLPARWAEPDLVLREALQPAARIAKNAVVVAATALAWMCSSLLLLLVFVGWLIADGPRLAGVIAFPLLWATLTWLLFVRTSRRIRRR